MRGVIAIETRSALSHNGITLTMEVNFKINLLLLIELYLRENRAW